MPYIRYLYNIIIYNTFGRFTIMIVLEHEWKYFCLPGSIFGNKNALAIVLQKYFLNCEKSKYPFVIVDSELGCITYVILFLI